MAIIMGRLITDTTSADDIYKRTMPLDINRLNRIVSNFDRIIAGHVTPPQQALIRREVIRDLAGLARANPDDPEIAAIIHVLPKGPIPDLPDSPRETIRMDEAERRKKGDHRGGDFILEEQVERTTLARPPRRRFHKRLTISR
jgi:hypothetical protein